jgi:hypothetical protein
MTISVSTGLRNRLLDTGSLSSILATGIIKIYSGGVPTAADSAITGTLLCTISLNSTGAAISMAGSASGGVLSKTGGEVWSGANVASGVPSYYRHTDIGDTGLSSTTAVRVQGSVGITGADLLVALASLVTLATTTIDSYTVSLPEA